YTAEMLPLGMDLCQFQKPVPCHSHTIIYNLYLQVSAESACQDLNISLPFARKGMEKSVFHKWLKNHFGNPAAFQAKGYIILDPHLIPITGIIDQHIVFQILNLLLQSNIFV